MSALERLLRRVITLGRRYTVEIERTARASRDVAFNLLRDAESWASWAGPPITYSGWDGGPREGDVVVGRVRLVGTPQFKTAEQITVDDAPTTHGYQVLARWPVRDYSARVVLSAGPEDMLTVHWSGQFEERIPGSGLLWRAFLSRFLARLAGRLLERAALTSHS
jgi:hypothetical protein